jgi:hypothetical protein
VFPDPPVLAYPAAPPPDPPACPTLGFEFPPAPPPPVDVIVENIDGEPGKAVDISPVLDAPPAPIVIGKDVPPVNVNFVPPGIVVR